EWLAKQLGQPIVTGAGVAYAMPKWYKVESGLTIELENTPVSATPLAIYDELGARINGTLSGKTVTFAGGVTVGDIIEVRTYTYATSASTESIKIDNAVFAKC